jgi:hypothetical protein
MTEWHLILVVSFAIVFSLLVREAFPVVEVKEVKVPTYADNWSNWSAPADQVPSVVGDWRLIYWRRVGEKLEMMDPNRKNYFSEKTVLTPEEWKKK